MDFKTLVIVILMVLLIASAIYICFLERKIMQLKEADMIDDITSDYGEEEVEENCKILYL